MARNLGAPSRHEVELGEINSGRDKTGDSDNQDESLLSEHEAKDAVPMLQPDPVGSNKQALFWVAVNIVATVLIVRYTHTHAPSWKIIY